MKLDGDAGLAYPRKMVEQIILAARLHAGEDVLDLIPE